MELKKSSPRDFQAAQTRYRKHRGFMCRDERHAFFDSINLDDLDGSLRRLLASALGRGAPIGEMTVTNCGDMLLHAAARSGCFTIIDILLSLGLDIDAVNNDGETALLQACRAGHVYVAMSLTFRGADTTITAHNGETDRKSVV